MHDEKEAASSDLTANDPDMSREAFMAAIVKLADDEAFRESFLLHYQLWLHPPMIVTPDVDGLGLNMAPGAITYMTEEQIASLNRVAPHGFEARKAALNAVLKETP